MPRSTPCPRELRFRPFRASEAVAAGLVTRAQLLGPQWRRLFRDVHIHIDVPLDHPAWCAAALLTAPAGTALGFRSALGFYCPALMPAVDFPVDLVVPRPANLRPQPRRRIHRTRLEPSDVRRFCGFPITTPARTALDLAREDDLITAVSCVDALLNRRMTTIGEIRARTGGRPSPGGATVRQVLSLASPGAESPMETRTRLLLVLAGLPMPVVQYEVRQSGVFVARLDLAYPEYRVGIEYDGDHHRDRDVFRRDAVRANRLRLAGWTVLRFTADDVLRNPDRVVRQVRTLLTRTRNAR